MEKKQDHYEVGVIVARFQVHELHSVHRDLIETVLAKHPKVIIFLGLAPTKCTNRNPLDFETRKKMLLAAYPQLNVLYIKDMASDELWSKKLDEAVEDLTGPNHKAVLYGGRSSFIDHYHGKLPTIEFDEVQFVSGAELRKSISSSTKESADFRAGVIWAMNNQFPLTITTVDVAIEGWKDGKIERLLLVRKPNETLFRFVGGFSNPQSESFELDAAGEVQEEVGVAIGGASDLIYIGSRHVKDWRYGQELNQIKTILFAAQYIYGHPQPDDDVCEARWFDLRELKEHNLVEEHRELFKMWKKFRSIS